MARRTQLKDRSRWKIATVAVLFGLGWLGLWGRAAYVQLVQGEHLSGLARRQHVAADFERGERGQILDRNGRQLAGSIAFNSVYVRPVQVEDRYRTAVVLAKILGQPRKKISARLSSRRHFVWVARQIDDRKAAAIRKAELPGVFLTAEYGRIYPNRQLAGQLLGFVGVDNRGLEGVERAFEDVLAGRKAEFVAQRDASGRKLYLDARGREMDIDGHDVRLTIDSQIQEVAESALARAVAKHNAKSGSCIVVDVEKAEILALANYPFFNPNVFRKQSPDVWRNRAAIDVFEPGSTLKPFLMAAAMQDGILGPGSRYYCENGRWKLDGHTIRDTHKYEWLTANEVLRYSSNIGTAKIGLSLGAQKYHRYLEKLGFGEKPLGDIPGAGRGLVRPPGDWTRIDLAAASFGQGIGVTTLQLAQAYLCLARKGVATPLKLVLDPPGKTEPGFRVFDAKVADAVLKMMVEVVELDGTGRQARIPGIVVGAKTGTAQKASAEGGYGKKYVASFAALVPGDAPKYLIVAVVDEPGPVYYGGIVAGPLVRDVAVKTLAYYCRLPEAPITAEVVVASPQASSELAAQAVAPRKITAPGKIPDFTGMDLRRAMEILVAKGIVPVLEGQGVVVGKQQPAAGRPWPEKSAGASFTLWLKTHAES